MHRLPVATFVTRYTFRGSPAVSTERTTISSISLLSTLFPGIGFGEAEGWQLRSATVTGSSVDKGHAWDLDACMYMMSWRGGSSARKIVAHSCFLVSVGRSWFMNWAGPPYSATITGQMSTMAFRSWLADLSGRSINETHTPPGRRSPHPPGPPRRRPVIS